jgi:hypothetical protein
MWIAPGADHFFLAASFGLPRPSSTALAESDHCRAGRTQAGHGRNREGGGAKQAAQARKLRQPVHGLSTRAKQESNTPQPSTLRRSGQIDNQKVARIVIPIVSGT